MQQGVFAIFDALGFRGIWRRSRSQKADPTSVLTKLEELREKAIWKGKELLEELEPQLEGDHGISLRTQVMFLSDTIVVGTSLVGDGDGKEYADFLPVAVTCRVISEILAMAAVTDPPLAYRGCVTVGEFELGDQFIVGPAVDSAADSMDQADGAFVWLLPKARDIVMANHGAVQGSDFLGLWEVPIKGRNEYQTYVVVPFGERKPEERRAIIRASRTASRMTDSTSKSKRKTHSNSLGIIIEPKRTKRKSWRRRPLLRLRKRPMGNRHLLINAVGSCGVVKTVGSASAFIAANAKELGRLIP